MPFALGQQVYVNKPNHYTKEHQVFVVGIAAEPIEGQTFYHVEWYRWVEGRRWTSATGFCEDELLSYPYFISILLMSISILLMSMLMSM